MSIRTHDALPGILGSVFISVGSLGVGWFPLSASISNHPFVSYLQTQTVGLALTRSLVVVGVALLLHMWLMVGADVVRGTLQDASSLIMTGITWTLPLVICAPLFSRDVYSYYMQGRLQVAGFDPYVGGVAQVPGWFTSGVDPMWAESPVPYGPGWLLIERGVALLLPHSPMSAVIAFRLIAIVGIAIATTAVVSISKVLGGDGRVAVWLGILNPLVLMHFVAGAHNDALMVGLMAASLWACQRRVHWLAVLLAVLAWSIKPVGLAVLPFVIPGSNWRQYLKTSTVALGASLLVGWLLAIAASVSPLGWLGALTTPGSVRSWLSPMTALGMSSGGLLELFGFEHVQTTTVNVMRLVGTLITLSVITWLIVTRSRRSATRNSALALASLVAFGPVVQPWYLLWSFPLFAASGVRHMRTALTIVSLFALHGLANSSATADTFIDLSDGLAMALVVAIIVAVVISSRRERELINEAGRLGI